MKKARRARLCVSGELIHGLLKLPEDIEVCDVRLCLQGDGLPDTCQVQEGGTPRVIDGCELEGWHPNAPPD